MAIIIPEDFSCEDCPYFEGDCKRDFCILNVVKSEFQDHD